MDHLVDPLLLDNMGCHGRSIHDSLPTSTVTLTCQTTMPCLPLAPLRCRSSIWRRARRVYDRVPLLFVLLFFSSLGHASSPRSAGHHGGAIARSAPRHSYRLLTLNHHLLLRSVIAYGERADRVFTFTFSGCAPSPALFVEEKVERKRVGRAAVRWSVSARRH